MLKEPSTTDRTAVMIAKLLDTCMMCGYNVPVVVDMIDWPRLFRIQDPHGAQTVVKLIQRCVVIGK